MSDELVKQSIRFSNQGTEYAFDKVGWLCRFPEAPEYEQFISLKNADLTRDYITIRSVYAMQRPDND